jgi:putative nucleotidyltransferase with HDIG domain
MAEIVKIPLDKLEVGMVVVKFDKAGFTYPHYGKPFPNVMLKQSLVRSGVRYAYVRNETPSVPAPTPPVAPTPTPAQKSTPSEMDMTLKSLNNNISKGQEMSTPTIRDIQQSMVIHKEASAATSQFMTDAKEGKNLDTSVAKDVISELVSHCIKSPEAFVNMTRLKDFDNYTFTHSVNVSALTIAIGRRLGMSANEMNSLGMAGLMHDIGKMRISEAIINKPGKLTDDEFKIIKTHPALGYEYLKNNSNANDDVLLAVRHHHEKSDGSGYPDGLLEKDIPKFSKIISIADVYDAITSARSYHKGMMPSDALKIIFSWSGKHFNNTLVKFFISIMGVYPVGTLVVLNTNELAVIFEPNKSDPMRPKVLIVSTTSMEPISPTLFDLASYNIATQMPYKTIISSLDPRDFSISTNRIIEQYIGSVSK